MNYASKRLPSKVCLRLLKRRIEHQAPVHLCEHFMDEVDRAAWIMTMNALVDFVESNEVSALQKELEGAFYRWTIAEAWIDCGNAGQVAQHWYLRVFRSLLQFIWLSTKSYPRERFCEVIKLFSEPFSHQKLGYAKLYVRLAGSQLNVFDYLSSTLSQAGSSIYDAL